MYCSDLQDKINRLLQKCISLEEKAETCQTLTDPCPTECYPLYQRYLEAKSELKYNQNIYNNDCKMYQLFIAKNGMTKY
jgi:hypothetical protein